MRSEGSQFFFEKKVDLGFVRRKRREKIISRVGKRSIRNRQSRTARSSDTGQSGMMTGIS
jgi:hypothetical protein